MKKLVGPLVLSVGAFLGLYACMTSSSGGGGGTHVSFQFDTEIIGTPTAPTSTVPGKIITRTIESYCDEDVVVKDTSIDTSYYSISGGKLYIWEKGDCVAGSLSGSSTTIIGTWTATSFAGEVPGERVLVPAPYRASTCPSTLPADTSDSDFGSIKNASVTINITASKVNQQVSGDFCFGEAIAEAYTDSEDEDEDMGVTVTGSTCSSVTIKNTSSQKSLTISATIDNNTVTTSYKSGSKTCSISMAFSSPGTVPDCSEESELDSTFITCLSGLEFYSSAMAKKGMSREPGVVRELQKSLWSHRRN